MHIHLDAVGGVAGDMFVAAMLDARPDLTDRVLADAAAAVPAAVGVPSLTRGQSAEIACQRFALGRPNVLALAGAAKATTPRSRFADIASHIESAALSPGTAAAAIAILRLLAEVESRIHGVPVDAVHFHELAAWDTVMDVVAAGSIAAAFDGARWTTSPLPRGGGLVSTQHGLLPVPAPATALLLEGFVLRDDGIDGERVTPTGAAVLRHLVADPAAPAQGRLAGIGTGAGTRQLQGMPNILRALVFEEARAERDMVTVLSFEIDDMTGEEIGTALDRLRAQPGVLDVVTSALQGKKGRPVQGVRILAQPDAADAVARRCFLETTTLGLRRHDERRHVLDRRHIEDGPVALKAARRPDGSVTVKAENDAVQGDTLAERRQFRARAEGEKG